MSIAPSNFQRDLVPVSAAVYALSSGPTARDVAAVLFRRKRIILAMFFFILSAAMLAATWLRPYVSPPQYESGLKFIIKKERFDAVVTPADRSVPGITTAVSPQEIHSEIELLKSADVLERLAREAGVEMERLSRGLVAEPVVAGRNLTNLIAVRYRAPEPREVSRVLHRLPDIYLEKYLSVSRRPAALEYFRSQAEAFEQELREAEEEAAEFQKQQPALSAEAHHQQGRQKLADLERQRAETEAAIREADSRTAELTRLLGAMPATIPAARSTEEPVYLGRLKTQLLDVEARRAQATFYREIEQLDRRIEEVRRAIAAETTRPEDGPDAIANPARTSLESELLRNQVTLAGLRARRASLIEQERAAREQWAAGRLIAAENSVQWSELARRVKVAEENSLFYRKKYAEAREAELLDQKRVLNVSVAEEPRAPARVEKRNLWFYLAVGFLLAAAGGTAAGFITEMLDHSIHTPRQLENYSSLTVLACIPISKRG